MKLLQKRIDGEDKYTFVIESHDIIIKWGLICAIAGGSIGYGVAKLSHYVERLVSQ